MIRAVLSEPTDFRRLYLFRHPELDASHQGRAVGAGAAPLSRRGRAQVLEWAQWIDGVELEGVHCSPQPQCSESAIAIAQPRDLEPIADPRLCDQKMGEWEGKAWEELAKTQGDAVRAFFTDFGEVRAPSGESLGEAVERVLSWWVEIAPKSLGTSRAVVLPGSVLSGFAAALLGFRLSRGVSVSLPHGSMGVLDVYDNGARLQAWNASAFQ
jgi:broad specificity phosphatase PhoE